MGEEGQGEQRGEAVAEGEEEVSAVGVERGKEMERGDGMTGEGEGEGDLVKGEAGGEDVEWEEGGEQEGDGEGELLMSTEEAEDEVGRGRGEGGGETDMVHEEEEGGEAEEDVIVEGMEVGGGVVEETSTEA